MDNQGWTHATLHYRQNPEHYERWLPDGTVEIYAQSVGAAPTRNFFLTSVIDPQFNPTTLTYDANAAVNDQAVLTAVTDPAGGQLIFSYNTANPLLITQVKRSTDGLAAKFQYTNGQLTSITDPYGITSAFHYISGSGFIDQMTTPYGKTTFSSTHTATTLEADMTNPLSQTERVEYVETTSLVAASDTSVPTGGTVDNTKLNTANSFYWNRRAMADATAG